MPCFLLSVAILTGGGFSAYRILQNGFTVPTETESWIASVDVSVEEPEGGCLPFDILFGLQSSDNRFDRAVHCYHQQRLDEAIALLRSIPDNSEDYNLAQGALNFLQWESDLRYIHSARQELENQNWQAAILEIDLIFNELWKTEALLISNQAHSMLALQALDLDDLETAEMHANLISDERQRRRVLSDIQNR